MSDADHDREQARQLPEGDVIRILLEQHAQIRELISCVQSSRNSGHKSAAFDELRELLARHEAAEEMVLRPESRRLAGDEVTARRNQEESEATKALAELEKLDVGSLEFETHFSSFAKSVSEHAEAEEHEEFPTVISGCDEEERRRLGDVLSSAEQVAPTHPHPGPAGSPAGQWTTGPFASLMDRARDALKQATS